MRHIIPISGKDSLATAIVQMVREPDLPYEFLFCDVQMELPETYAWLVEAEKVLGITIKRVGKSLEDIIIEQNMLPSAGRRFCTKYGKIFPIRDFIGDDEAIQYLGIRADEEQRIAKLFGPENIEQRYPLVELGIGLPQVYQILSHRNVLPPSFFWERLYNAVMRKCDASCQKIVLDLKPWNRHALFSWRSRSNCFNCFYQRRYEWVGLLEYHPRLFDRAEALEIQYGGVFETETRINQFYWIKDLPLKEVRLRAEEIFERHVNKVHDTIIGMQQMDLFVHDFDPMTAISCGLYCGK